MQRYPIGPALLLALIALLMLASAAPLYAAGESLDRFAVLSGGGGDSAPGGALRSASGGPVAGLVEAGGATLCSGFLCAPALQPAACTPVAGVTINGPTIGAPGVPLNYTAVITPSTATGPVLHTWSPEPGSGQDGAAATFTFALTGTQVISVTTTNCGGSAVVEDEHSVTITESGGSGPLYLPSLQYTP